LLREKVVFSTFWVNPRLPISLFFDSKPWKTQPFGVKKMEKMIENDQVFFINAQIQSQTDMK